MPALRRPLAWTLACAALASGGCKPPTQPAVATQPVRLQPVTIALFWAEFTSPDQAKVEAALRLLAAQPDIAEQPFAANWSSPGGGLLEPRGVAGKWALADGTTITLDPTSLRHVPASIDAAVAAIETDASRHAQRKAELTGLVDRIGIAMWRAGADLERPHGGFFGESTDEQVARETALLDLRSHAVLLRRIALEQVEKMPPELVDEADLERRREVLREWRRIMLGSAPSSCAP